MKAFPRFAMMKSTFVALLLLVPATWAQTPQSYSWGATPPNVASVAWANQQIGSFLGTITASALELNVCDFTFADLDADGQLELLASIDISGRHFCNLLTVVRKNGGNYEVQEIQTLGVQSVQGVYANLNGDGPKELLVPTALTPYLGAFAPQAQWTMIYGWNRSLLVDSSQQFVAHYQSSILPGLQQALADLQASAPGTIEVDIAQIQYDKALRVSGQNPTAGLPLALSWASSGDSTHKIFAGWILADIGTTSALTALNTLASDPDSNVVIYSQSAIQALPVLHYKPVEIRIAPYEATASINIGARKRIPVAIRSSPTFDARELINVHSLTFGSTGTEASLLFCSHHGDGEHGDDEQGHDSPDLLCFFDSQASSFQLGDASGTLLGQLKDGTNIRGTAAIVIAGQRKKEHDKDEDDDVRQE